MPMRPKIGLALGAGGAKGLAHIGVLQVLTNENIPIDMIAGSSMGAIIGAAYAAGADLQLMEKLALNLNQALFLDVNLPRLGLLKGDNAMAIIRLLTHNKKFSELNIPLAIVATDIERGEKVIFREGDVASAVRASMSVPGVFNPVCINDRLLVDGAVTERLPVGILKEMGADIIIGVDVKLWSPQKIEINNIYAVIMQSIEIMEREACKPCLELCDVIINPDVSDISTADFSKAGECIKRGRLAAENKIELIKRVIEGFAPKHNC
ncbi:patatin family protein [Thermanaerosceptrum fracticalcis]|uniref:Patatin family protein n=2 Tax=Thermanaerosceptrum fracticalcis TaxID=1712410 RepID=A0A7G6E1K3_THEFR|nr:patatin family protein [Thermanaerosceptrum fracticalcis]